MIIKAQQKQLRRSPRKVRLVANAVKKMPLAEAIKQLAVIRRRSSLDILKVLKQAIANAINNQGMSFDQLELKNILVAGGPKYKRWRAVSRGRAHGIVKRTSHIIVELEKKEDNKVKNIKKTEKKDQKEVVKTTKKVKKITKKTISKKTTKKK